MERQLSALRMTYKWLEGVRSIGRESFRFDSPDSCPPDEKANFASRRVQILSKHASSKFVNDKSVM